MGSRNKVKSKIKIETVEYYNIILVEDDYLLLLRSRGSLNFMSRVVEYGWKWHMLEGLGMVIFEFWIYSSNMVVMGIYGE